MMPRTSRASMYASVYKLAVSGMSPAVILPVLCAYA